MSTTAIAAFTNVCASVAATAVARFVGIAPAYAAAAGRHLFGMDLCFCPARSGDCAEMFTSCHRFRVGCVAFGDQ
jgi:hypothetical protein